MTVHHQAASLQVDFISTPHEPTDPFEHTALSFHLAMPPQSVTAIEMRHDTRWKR